MWLGLRSGKEASQAAFSCACARSPIPVFRTNKPKDNSVTLRNTPNGRKRKVVLEIDFSFFAADQARNILHLPSAVITRRMLF
jgi:hypothetical protein